MPALSVKRRLQIAAAGYGVVVVFAGVFAGLRHWAMSLSSTEQLVISATAASPLLFALLWEHLKGFKVGEIEITLNEVTSPVNFELASNFQELEGSATPTLVKAISGAISRKDLKLV